MLEVLVLQVLLLWIEIANLSAVCDPVELDVDCAVACEADVAWVRKFKVERELQFRRVIVNKMHVESD